MAIRPIRGILHYLRRLSRPGICGDATDRQLLKAMSIAADERAFETLGPSAHGGTVLGVCRRVLCHEQDAEEAFQATFLGARKAASIGARETRNGLHGAGRSYGPQGESHQCTAAQPRNPGCKHASTKARLAKEVWSDLRPLLDRELQRRPAKYRSPIVLCDLEGKTRAEACATTGLARGHTVVAAGISADRCSPDAWNATA